MLKILVAVAHNNVIGHMGKMPWGHIKLDMQFFRKTTMGERVVMGYKTFKSIGSPLVGRLNMVMTRESKKLEHLGGSVMHVGSLQSLLAIAKTKDIYVLGGSELYQQVLPCEELRVLYITRIHHPFNGDTFFPEISMKEWRMIKAEPHGVSEENKYALTFETWVRT